MKVFGSQSNLYAGFSVAFLAMSVQADPVDDPWALLPAPPTGCYSGQDHFADSLAASMEQIEQEIVAQETANGEVKDQAFTTGEGGETDMMAMAQRMQQYMLDDPEKAMQMMQNLQAASATGTDDTLALLEREQEFAPALDKHLADYDAAYRSLYDSFDAKFAGLPTGEGEAGTFFLPEARGDLIRISGEANAEYKALCAKWFQSGPLVGWLEEYRGYLVDDRVPMEEERDNLVREQYEFQRVDVSNYHSTAAMEAARDYGKYLGRIFARRQEKPFDFADQFLGSN